MRGVEKIEILTSTSRPLVIALVLTEGKDVIFVPTWETRWHIKTMKIGNFFAMYGRFIVVAAAPFF